MIEVQPNYGIIVRQDKSDTGKTCPLLPSQTGDGTMLEDYSTRPFSVRDDTAAFVILVGSSRK